MVSRVDNGKLQVQWRQLCGLWLYTRGEGENESNIANVASDLIDPAHIKWVKTTACYFKSSASLFFKLVTAIVSRRVRDFIQDHAHMHKAILEAIIK